MARKNIKAETAMTVDAISYFRNAKKTAPENELVRAYLDRAERELMEKLYEIHKGRE